MGEVKFQKQLLERFGSETAQVALVSCGLPPGHSGYHHILQQLLGAIPEDRIATIGVGERGFGARWGRRVRVPFPARRSSPIRIESLITAVAAVGSELVAGQAWGRLLPNVRRIFATMDPMLGFATSWAKHTNAELWVYAIDLHIGGYWRSGKFLQQRMLRWRDEAFRYATRVFALSDVMADWLRSIGVTRQIEILPPLFPVGEPAPLPDGPLTFLMSGSVYSVNANPLRWLERAVFELAPGARLRLLTPTDRASLTASRLDLAKWSIASVPPEDVAAEVARATWTVIGLDSGRSDDGERVAWPTKLREYLSVGRPVLCISRPEYAVSRMVAANGWGLFTQGEDGTREAVRRIVAEGSADLERRARAANSFARAHIDDATIGRELRRDILAG